MNYIGVDGCKSGWFYFGINNSGGYQYGVLEEFCDFERFIDQAELILVDIPIGLPSAGQPERLCDKEARKMISPRGSSVFPVPTRSALDKNSHREAADENERVLGRRISAQTWGIAPKIKEVDGFLRAARPGKKIREMHPEVAFCALNGGKTLSFPKKDGCGAIERLEILKQRLTINEHFLFDIKKSLSGRKVATDDILDAMAGAVTARQHHQLGTLPKKPLLDDEGLPMEIVYWAGANQ